MRRVVRRTAVFSVALSLLSVGSAGQSNAAAVANTKLCVYAKPRNGETNEQAISKLETKIGRRFAVHKHFVWWDDPFPATQEAEDAKRGRTPMIDWKATHRTQGPIKWAEIASGARDTHLKKKAAALKAYGRHVYFSFHHEPENDTRTHGTAKDFIGAFRRVQYVFHTVAGIPKDRITWVEALMAATFDAGKQNTWYAGDAYVERIGLNGYNWYPGKPGSTWRTLADIFTKPYNWAASKRKGVMITETGVMEDPKWTGGGNRKALWFDSALATIKKWPYLKEFCYWHSDGSRGYPFWVDSSSASVTAFKRLANDAWMKA